MKKLYEVYDKNGITIEIVDNFETAADLLRAKKGVSIYEFECHLKHIYLVCDIIPQTKKEDKLKDKLKKALNEIEIEVKLLNKMNLSKEIFQQTLYYCIKHNLIMDNNLLTNASITVEENDEGIGFPINYTIYIKGKIKEKITPTINLSESTWKKKLSTWIINHHPGITN
ncbi:MAG: hypothetical protein ACOC3V_04135 [bacterium]